MNIQSGKVRGRQNPRSKSDAGSLGARLAVAFRVGVVLAAVGALANAYIYLNQKISETGREIKTTRQEIHNAGREIDNLIVRRATLSSWPHIRESIQRYSLNLRPAAPQQVRRLVLIAPSMASQVALAEDNLRQVDPARRSYRR